MSSIHYDRFVAPGPLEERMRTPLSGQSMWLLPAFYVELNVQKALLVNGVQAFLLFAAGMSD
jgi:hypothetical protein